MKLGTGGRDAARTRTLEACATWVAQASGLRVHGDSLLRVLMAAANIRFRRVTIPAEATLLRRTDPRSATSPTSLSSQVFPRFVQPRLFWQRIGPERLHPALLPVVEDGAVQPEMIRGR